MLNALSPLFAYLFSYLRREEGQDFIEYALIIVLIIFAAVVGMSLVGDQVAAIWTTVTNWLVTQNQPPAS